MTSDLCACFEPRSGTGVWWRLGSAAFLAVNGMVLGLAVNGSEVTPDERRMLESATGLVALAIACLLGGELVAGVRRARGMSLELLFLLGIVGSVGGSVLSLWKGVGGTYFDVAGLLLVIYSLGREVGRYGQERLLAQIGATERVEVAVGDRVLVLPGQAAPADGVIVRGSALVQEAHLTGESMPRRRDVGDSFRAGAFVLDASVWMEVRALPEESEAAQVSALMRERLWKPGRQLALAQRVLRWFVPLVGLVAALTFWLHDPWEAALSHAMAVLVIACPCALGFAAPLTVWGAMERLRQMGILCRSGESLERLAEVDTVVFDKTGTLSELERYRVRMEMADGWVPQQETVLLLLAVAERASGHPLGRAMAALWEGVALGAVQMQEVTLLPGRGIAATLAFEGRDWRLVAEADGYAVRVTIDGERAATVHFEEAMREGLPEMFAGLAGDGMRLVLATGDEAGRANKVDIAERHAGQKAGDKLALVDELVSQGRKVLFLGDGLNDGPAMAASHVGMTVMGASAAMEEAASLLSVRADWHSLPVALRVARQAVAGLRRSITVAVAYNVVGMAVAAAGWLHPVGAALLMTASSMTVILIALNVLNLEVAGEDRVLG